MSKASSPEARLLERFARNVGRGINRFDMIGEGDRVLIGVSGGKDSLALALALVERRKWVPVSYELHAAQVEWREYPMTEQERGALDAFFDKLGIPFTRIPARIAPPTFRKKFSCYTCARNRKRILFNEAARVGARTIALAHHMDDIACTMLMNMFFHGELATMMPVQRFFGGQLQIIRPMCEVREREVVRLAARLGLPTAPNRCPNADTNSRGLMREILRQASHKNRNAVRNVYNSAWRVNQAYLPAPDPAAGSTRADDLEATAPEDWL
jgi:tRNA 2-thiocytidine biosynthesis protein TtcA